MNHTTRFRIAALAILLTSVLLGQLWLPKLRLAAGPQGLVLRRALLPIMFGPPAAGNVRPWPDTTRGVHVFNDQLNSAMSDAQVQFSATHYAGCQKMTRSQADRLRAVNPNLLILHYRLGEGLGYRAVEADCQPTGDWLLIIEGDNWVQEWPGEENVRESWFYHWPETGAPPSAVSTQSVEAGAPPSAVSTQSVEASTTRVLMCDWGWYLMNLDDGAFRAYWQAQVLRQVQIHDNDGLFMDSLSVPNYLGADHWRPALPDVDASFENAWASRIERWLLWLQSQPIGRYYIVPNVGSWITTRDPTDYSAADGVMVEGFALEADASPHAYDDWVLEMNRILGLVSRGKAILAQTYVGGAQERMFALGSYLLIKGSRTYLNIEISDIPEWWPEYDIPIGVPTEGAGSDIARLYDAVDGVYRRRFDNGMVLVNPTNPWDGTGVTRIVPLGATYYQAVGHGGGEVPESGVSDASLSYQAVTQVTLPPYTAVVLFERRP